MLAPEPRGPVSEVVLSWLTGSGEPDAGDVDAAARAVLCNGSAACDEDLQITLWTLYELHYGGFDDVDDRWEWAPATLAVRRQLERELERWLRSATADTVASALEGCDDVAEALFAMAADAPGPSLSGYLQRQANREQMLEFLIHRTVYHLKEADPHSWAIPRLTGAPKVALVEVQYDEYGAGRPERLHASMFADTLQACGLDTEYGAYVEQVPAVTLAINNAMSMFGLHRRLRAAAMGHLAAFEATSSLPARRISRGLQRMGFGTAATAYFDEHVEADAVHEQIAARSVCGALAEQDASVVPDLMFGAASCLHLDALAAEQMVGSWTEGASSLRDTSDLADLAGV